MFSTIPLYKYTAMYLLIRPLVDILFQFGDIMNSAPVCIHVHVFWEIYSGFFASNIPENDVARV